MTKQENKADTKLEKATKHSNLVLAIVVLGTMMGALDVTMDLPAFPAITESLHADAITSIWIILAYLLVTALRLLRLVDWEIFMEEAAYSISALLFSRRCLNSVWFFFMKSQQENFLLKDHHGFIYHQSKH